MQYDCIVYWSTFDIYKVMEVLHFYISKKHGLDPIKATPRKKTDSERNTDINSMNMIKIQLSKRKILLLLFKAGGLLIFGVLLVIKPQLFVSPTLNNPLRIVGIAVVLFCSAGVVYGLRRLFSKSKGLTIDDNGIFDNSNASSIGLIKWADITEIRTKRLAWAKLLLIYTANPNSYLYNVRGFKRILLEGNLMMYGTPLTIISTELEYNMHDLEKLINDRVKAFENAQK